MSLTVDLNADLGEHPGSTLDEQIMPFISSCNVACGGHIGNEFSVRNTIRLAKENEVAIGAHPSFPDKANFGRQAMDISEDLLVQSLEEQIGLVQRICDEEKEILHHIKPHGALYNHAAENEQTASLIIKVLQKVAAGVPWMGLADSVSEKVAREANYPFIREGFADRRYQSDGTLVSRSIEGAMLTREEIHQQVLDIVLNHRVKAEEWINLDVQSLCLHSDTAGAVELADEIHELLRQNGVKITTF